VLFTAYYSGEHFKECEIFGASGIGGGEVERIQGFVGETYGKN
jgi:hypothetical protein